MTEDELTRLGPEAIALVNRLKQVEHLDFVLDQLHGLRDMYDKLRSQEQSMRWQNEALIDKSTVVFGLVAECDAHSARSKKGQKARRALRAAFNKLKREIRK